MEFIWINENQHKQSFLFKRTLKYSQSKLYKFEPNFQLTTLGFNFTFVFLLHIQNKTLKPL